MNKLFNISLCFILTLNFGYSQSIIYRNKTMQNDDLYVTGNLGDSYIGLNILKKKIKLSKFQNKYFINKYYKPELHLKLVNQLKKFASSSIDISDGLFADLDKLINKLYVSYKVKLKDVPISKNLSLLIKNEYF